MSRPRKNTVDYFPHTATHKETIYILEQQFGNDGYALWYKLLEQLATTENHYIDTKNSKSLLYLSSRAKLTKDKCLEVLNLLSELDAIDLKLWKEKGVIWCQNFVDGIADVYKKRKVGIPQKPDNRDINGSTTIVSAAGTLVQLDLPEHAGNGNPQSKVKETRAKEIKEEKEKIKKENFEKSVIKIIMYLNGKTGKNYRTQTKTFREAISARLAENYTIGDFKTVIDNMHSYWIGTEQEQYLTPSTLFCSKHFDNYLNKGLKQIFTKPNREGFKTTAQHNQQLREKHGLTGNGFIGEPKVITGIS